MASGEQIGGCVLAVVVVATLWFAKMPIGTVNNKVLIPPKNVPGLIRHGEEIDGAMTITHVKTGDALTADWFLGNLYWTPQDRDSGIWKVKYTHYRYLIDPGWDIGAFAGYYDNAVEAGLRLSPVRLLYGTVAIDGLIGTEGAGAGISLYPMPEYFGRFWNHLGIGYGCEVDYKTSSSGNLFYTALSTRF